MSATEDAIDLHQAADEQSPNHEQREPEMHASLSQLLGGSATATPSSSLSHSLPLTNGRSSLSGSLPLPTSMFASLPLPLPASQQHQQQQQQLSKFLSPAGIIPYSSHLRGIGELSGEFGSTSRRKQEFQQSMQYLTDAVQRVVGTPQSADEELRSLRAELQVHESNRIQAQKAYDDLLRAYQEQRGKNAELMEELASMNDQLVRAKAALRTQLQTSEPRGSLDLSGFSFLQARQANDSAASISAIDARQRTQHHALAVPEEGGGGRGLDGLMGFDLGDEGSGELEGGEAEGRGGGGFSSDDGGEHDASSGEEKEEEDGEEEEEAEEEGEEDDEDEQNNNNSNNEDQNAGGGANDHRTNFSLNSTSNPQQLFSSSSSSSTSASASASSSIMPSSGDTDEIATQDLLQTSELVESFFLQATSRVSELEATIDRQSEEISGLQQREAALLAEQQRLQASMAEQQAQQQQAVERLEAEQGQYVDQIEDLQEKSQEAKEFSEQLVKELASLKIAHRTALQKLTHAEGQVGAVHLRNEQANQAAQLLHEEISTLNRERKAREALFRSQEEDLALQRSFVAQLQEELQSSVARADALDETLKATQQQLRSKEHELSELGRNKQNIMGHISRLKNQVSTRMSTSSVSVLPPPSSTSSLSSLDTSSSSSSSSFASTMSSPHTVTGSLPLFSPIVPLPASRKSTRPAAAATPFFTRPPTSRASFEQLLPSPMPMITPNSTLLPKPTSTGENRTASELLARSSE